MHLNLRSKGADGSESLADFSVAFGGTSKFINGIELVFRVRVESSDLAQAGVVVSAGIPDAGSGHRLGVRWMAMVPETKSKDIRASYTQIC